MKTEQIRTYGMASNCYIIADGGECAVIDPSAKPEYILEAAGENKIKYIFLTHGHFDHTKYLVPLREITDSAVCIHAEDNEMLSDADKSAYNLFNSGTQDKATADILFHDGDSFSIGNSTVTVLHTPGHSKGSSCFMTECGIFTGDTLLSGSIGRYDFYGSSDAQLFDSLRRLVSLEGDYVLYPGHGEKTALNNERKNNPYLNGDLFI